MIIFKRVDAVIPADQSKSGRDEPVPYCMYWRIGAGWIADKLAASVFTQDEHVTHWLDVASATVLNNQAVNVLETR